MATDARSPDLSPHDPVRITNRHGAGAYVVVCEHASHYIPAHFGTLGLSGSDRVRHIAWDPGALPVARALAGALDGTLVESCISRLLIDCNRPLDAPDLVPETSERTTIPGNFGLSHKEREARIELSHRPFHDALEAVVAERRADGRECRIVTIHSFTPVYKDVPRPWQVGIIHDEDARLALPLISGLEALAGINVGVNQPYSPADRVYYTLERHARPVGLPCAMIEIRNDEIADAAAQALWARRLATILSGIQEPDLNLGVDTASNAKGTRRRA